MQFEIQPIKTYTNTITHSVGPTTSLTTRSLVDSNTAHFMYLDATNGDDGNGGTGPTDAKKTFDAAYAAMSGSRYVIYIIDSSTYTSALAVIDFSTVSVKEGIQAALGQTPVLQLSSEAYIQLTPSASADKILSGMSIITGTEINTGGYAMIECFGDASSLFTITDCYLYNRRSDPGVGSTYEGNMIYNRCINLTDFDPDFTIEYNIIISDTSGNPVYFYNANGTAVVNKNIIYMNSTPLDGTREGDWMLLPPYLGGSAYDDLYINFDQPTLVATLVGGAGKVSSMTAGRWAGYALKLNKWYYIISNTTTQFYLEDRWGGNNATASNFQSWVGGLNIEAGIFVSDNSNDLATMDITKNIIVGKGHRNGIQHSCIHAATSDNINVYGCVILNTKFGIALSKADPESAVAFVGTINASQNIFYSTTEYEYTDLSGTVDTPDVGMVITSTNVFSNSLVPLYFDQISAIKPTVLSPYVDSTLGYVKCAYDFRLRVKGKKYYATDTQNMILTSPFYNLYSGTSDLDPWEETLVEGALSYGDTITIYNTGESIQINPTPKNPVELYDMHGNLNADFDAWRREFVLTWGSGIYMSNELVWDIEKMFRDKKAKQFYPLGIGVSLITDSTYGSLTQTSSTTAEFIPNPMSAPFKSHHWDGFWITLEDSLGDVDYYIESNDGSTFYLIDKLGNGFPGDHVYTFKVQYILVKIKIQTWSYGQQYFTAFRKGGQLQEKPLNEGLEHEYNGVTITLCEVENPL